MAARIPTQFDVLYEDNHLMVVAKPARLPTMGTAEGPTLLTVVKEYLKEKYAKPGNVYLGVVSRLDAPVTGVVALARTSKAADRLNEQFRSRAVEKVYWAVVEGRPSPPEGAIAGWVAQDSRSKRMRVVGEEMPGAKEARLRYRLLRSLDRDSLLEVGLDTGRKHQIRIQLADRGHPVVGDLKYGSQRPFAAGIALHARRLTLEHPVRRLAMTFEAPVPASWAALGVSEP